MNDLLDRLLRDRSVEDGHEAPRTFGRGERLPQPNAREVPPTKEAATPCAEAMPTVKLRALLCFIMRALLLYC